jgi:hypothetical protein
MKMHNDTNLYRSNDLYMAAYLQTAGVPMIRTERDPKGKVTFVFDTSVANIEELKQAWSTNQGKVAAQPYAMAIKSLKAVVHMG